MQELKERLNHRISRGIYRTLSLGKEIVDFASNDYLGFARSKELLENIKNAIALVSQVGSTGSRLLTGNTTESEHLEEEIAHFHHAQAGLLFPTGYTANLALLSAIARREDTILYDKQAHASLRDGIVLSRAKNHAFHHNDCHHLFELLKKTHKPAMVCIESLYSTDGSLAPLKEIVSLCEQFHAKLIVDEAHATGVFGKGLTVQAGVENQIFARIHTFGKALGVQGAIVLGSPLLREYLINFARPFIYSTAPSLIHLASIRCAYALLEKANTSISRLQALCAFAGMKTAIQAIKATNVKKLSQELLKRGFDVRPLVYPTVPEGEECLRLTLH